jgi:hypothetical protein
MKKLQESITTCYAATCVSEGAAGLSEMETALFGEVEARVIRPQFEPTYATQGKPHNMEF